MNYMISAIPVRWLDYSGVGRRPVLNNDLTRFGQLRTVHCWVLSSRSGLPASISLMVAISAQPASASRLVALNFSLWWGCLLIYSPIHFRSFVLSTCSFIFRLSFSTFVCLHQPTQCEVTIHLLLMSNRRRCYWAKHKRLATSEVGSILHRRLFPLQFRCLSQIALALQVAACGVWFSPTTANALHDFQLTNLISSIGTFNSVILVHRPMLLERDNLLWQTKHSEDKWVPGTS